jgi:hypothetical protein
VKIPSDEEIRNRCNAVGTNDGVEIKIGGEPYFLPRYIAFRFCHFLERAILDSCHKSGKRVDDGFAR